METYEFILLQKILHIIDDFIKTSEELEMYRLESASWKLRASSIKAEIEHALGDFDRKVRRPFVCENG